MTVHERLIEFLRVPRTIKEIQQMLGVSKKVAHNNISDLRKYRTIKKQATFQIEGEAFADKPKKRRGVARPKSEPLFWIKSKGKA